MRNNSQAVRRISTWALLFAGVAGCSAQLTVGVEPQLDAINNKLAGTWYRVDAATSQHFAARIRFTKLTFATGIFEDLVYGGKMQYSLSEEGTGILITDRADHLIITYGFTVDESGADPLLTLTNWNREHVYARAPLPPVEVTVTLTTFIPANYIRPPSSIACATLLDIGVFHRGDNRIDQASGKAQFDPAATSFRTRHSVKVFSDGSKASPSVSGPAVLDLGPEVGETMEYAWDALANGVIDASDNDATLGDCKLLNNRGTARTNAMKVSSRVTGALVSVRIHGGAYDPLVPSVAIDWDVNVEFDFSKPQATFVVSGAHDGFPAYELYINNALVWSHDPGAPSWGCKYEVRDNSGRNLINPIPGYCDEQVNLLIPFLDVKIPTTLGTLPRAPVP